MLAGVRWELPAAVAAVIAEMGMATILVLTLLQIETKFGG